MNLTEYILLPREERTAHIDLSTPCECEGRQHLKRQGNGKIFKKLCENLGVENDVVNRGTARIDTCHLCSEKHCQNPLHAYIGTAKENRNDIPQEQRCEAARKANESRTPEQRSEATRKAMAAMTPEQRSEKARRAQAGRTPEQRSESARKAQAARTPEQRREAARKREAAMTPERKREWARKVGKAVELTHIETGRMSVFISVREAARTLGLSHGKLSEVSSGRRGSTKGYTARYL